MCAAPTTAIDKKIRLAVVDDHQVVRSAVEAILSREPNFEVVLTGATVGDLHGRVLASGVDVLVLDIALADGSAIDVLSDLMAALPRLAVVIYTGFPEARYAMPLVRLGARAYVEKNWEISRLIDSVKTVAAGGTYFSEGTQRQIEAAAAGHDASLPTDPSNLTSREFQIFLRLAAGESVKAIARALMVSEVTVGVHRARLLKKLRMKTNSDLARWAFEAHILRPPLDLPVPERHEP